MTKIKITYYILTWGSGIITMHILPTTSGQAKRQQQHQQQQQQLSKPYSSRWHIE